MIQTGDMVYIPPPPGKEAMPRPGQPMPSLWPAPTNVPLGVAAPGRAGDEGAQSGEKPEACHTTLSAWNDDPRRTKAEVLNLYDRTITNLESPQSTTRRS